MSYSVQSSLGPLSTPKVIQYLIGITTVITLLLGLTEHLIQYLTGVPSLGSFLSLSMQGVMHGFIWQPLTYVFIYNSFGSGISLSIILPLLFHMYLLWVVGSLLVERFGARSFLALYLTSSIVAGLAAVVTMLLTGSTAILSGASGPILALLVVWVMLNPEMEVLLFLTIPIKALWLILGYIGIVLLIDLSQGNLVDLMYVITCVLAGYTAATVAFDLQGPFATLHVFEGRLNRLGERLRTSNHPIPTNSKIIPLPGTQALNDDEEFLDAMLTKIAHHGEKSLSWRERRRLNQISQTKKKR